MTEFDEVALGIYENWKVFWPINTMQAKVLARHLLAHDESETIIDGVAAAMVSLNVIEVRYCTCAERREAKT